MAKLYRVVFYNGEQVDKVLEPEEEEKLYFEEEVKIITPLFDQERLAFLR